MRLQAPLFTFAVALSCAAATACSSTPIALHVPQMPPSAARTPTAVEVEPIGTADDDQVVIRKRKGNPEGARPELVLTDGMRTELAARALRGGEPGGYVARCKLDRFAVRDLKESGYAMMIVYADLGCEVSRKIDRVVVWRGELHGRSAAGGKATLFASDDEMWQRFADRAMSDASRELASDLAVGVLRLDNSPSGRVFPDTDAERHIAGVDDVAPYGAWALAESVDAARRVAEAGELRHPDPRVRSAAWNVVAMAALPEGSWVAGIDTVLDEDAFVRFFEYKALGRYESQSTLIELKTALKRENQDLLRAFIQDTLAAGGIGVRR